MLFVLKNMLIPSNSVLPRYASGGELFDYIVAKGRVPELEAEFGSPSHGWTWIYVDIFRLFGHKDHIASWLCCYLSVILPGWARCVNGKSM